MGVMNGGLEDSGRRVRWVTTAMVPIVKSGGVGERTGWTL